MEVDIIESDIRTGHYLNRYTKTVCVEGTFVGLGAGETFIN